MSKYFYWNGLKIVANMIKNGVITKNKLATAVQTKLNAKELPTVTSDDNGDVLTVVEGEWAKGTISHGHNYSTDEQVVGTWIDGKPIYEKTIVVTSGINTNTETQIPHGVSNIDYRTFVSGMIIRSRGDHTPIPSTSIGGAAYYNGVENISDTAIIFWCGSLNGESITKLIVTIRYTKTTDIAAE